MKSIFKALLFLSVGFHFALSASWQENFKKKVESGERPEWMMNRIHKDLEPFKKGITKSMLDGVAGMANLARFKIINGVVYCTGAEQTDAVFKAIKEINAIAPLPPLDMILSRHDSFYHHFKLVDCKGPLFSFAKREKDVGIILIPDHMTLGGYGDNYKEVMKGKALYPWEKKQPKAFWRGINSGFLPGSLAFMNPRTYLQYPRCKLVKLSLEKPTYLDARFNTLQAIDPSIGPFLTRLGYLGNTVTISEHLKYKYQILVDGYTCAFHRTWWELFADCLILKQESPDFQWYYDDLKPNVHYVPVAYDFSDLPAKIDWARSHDDEVRKIIQNANQFAESHIKHEDIMYYVYLLLTEYSKLMK